MTQPAGEIESAVAALGRGPLAAESLQRHLWPLFSRVLARTDIYLANHSLGRPLDRTADDVRASLEAWYRDLGDAWDGWLAERERFRTLVARLVGAPRPDCIVPKTSAGQGLRAVLNALSGEPRVATTDGEFDSIDFILRNYRKRGRIALRVTPWRELSVEQAELIVVSSVLFRSGERVTGLRRMVRDAHAAGALVLLDVYHHAGVLPLDLGELDVDFAIGGSYKYLRGGPGACWLYVRPGLAETLRTLDTGWFAKREPFAYLRPEPPEFGPGGDAWLESTPAVLAHAQARAGLELTLALGVERLREYNLQQKALLADALFRVARITAEGVSDDYGAFVSIVHPEAGRLVEALAAKGVTADARGDRLRLCPDILNSDEALLKAAALIGEVLSS
ncbi:MAG: aminotransferase class V-fold PLP-dependent enzyme [Burkholderiales bacterium]|nr:aminotransferase class V-fold PLP-dependent enzyme [Burkholderiales bacterium]